MNVLAMVAHPDDEVLGVGGTLAKHAANGDAVYVAYLTNGVGAREADSKAVADRIDMSHKAAKILGAQVISTPMFPDNAMDSVALLGIVRAVEGYVEVARPDIVYTHHGGDLNIDHQICQRAVLTACRPVQGSSVKAIYAMEVASSTEWNISDGFRPNRFVDVSSTLMKKELALQAYQEEMRPFPHPRSYNAILALAHWRGSSSGLTAAEAFMVLREIDS